MKLNFKTAFEVTSGYFAAKLVWKILGSELLNIYDKVGFRITKLLFEYLDEKAKRGNMVADKVCEMMIINSQGKPKEKETIGFKAN